MSCYKRIPVDCIMARKCCDRSVRSGESPASRLPFITGQPKAVPS